MQRRSDRLGPLLSACGVSLVLIATPLEAQLVRGIVAAPTDSAPVAGVLVALVNLSGNVVVQAMSDERGKYALRAPSPGSYRLRALRIGFRPTIGEPFEVTNQGITERSLILTGAVVRLAVTRVSASERCNSESDTTSLGFHAWEQARTALAVSMATRQSSQYDVDVVAYKLRRDPQRDSVIEYTEEISRTSGSRAFTAMPLNRLRDSGYVVRDAAGVHAAQPDEEILLSEDFATSHCIRALKPQGDTIVLAFEPTRDRRLSDIAGSLILSRETNELRSLSYEYVNVPPDEREVHSGGELSFLRLPTGGWIVRRWRIRFPILERRESQTLSGGTFGEAHSRVAVATRVIEWQEAGGEAFRVAVNGTLVWRTPTTTLRGIVVDDSLSQPVAGADIRTTAASSGTPTDTEGRFVLPDVRIGDIQVLVAPAYAPLLGAAPRRFHVTTRADGPWAELRVPHPRRAVVEACAAAGHPLSRGAEPSIVRGILRDAFGSRAGSADVSITWAVRAPALENETRTMRLRTSITGDYVACGLPVDLPLQLRAFVSDTLVGEASTRIPSSTLGIVVDLHPPVR